MPAGPLSLGHQILALLNLDDPSSSTIREKFPCFKQLAIRKKSFK